MTTFHPETPKKCPPKDAVSPNGIFFRFVFNDPPIPNDFVIWVCEPENKRHLNHKKKQGKVIAEPLRCQCCQKKE